MVNNTRITDCECLFGGWCDRHKTYKSNSHFQLCKTRTDKFNEYEEGGGFRLKKPPKMPPSRKDTKFWVFGYFDESLDFIQQLGLPFRIFRISDKSVNMVTHIIGNKEGQIPPIESETREDWLNYILDITGAHAEYKAMGPNHVAVRESAEFGFLLEMKLDGVVFVEFEEDTSYSLVVGNKKGDTLPLGTEDPEEWETYIKDALSQRKAPNILKKAVNLGKAMAKHVANNKKMANGDVISLRLEHCNKCEFLKDGECLLCGCPVEEKAKWASESCPAQPSRWVASNAGKGCGCGNKR